jgi:hypothetical protein
MSNPGSATTHSSRACRALTLATLAVFVLATVARGDIGIRKLMPTSARPGEQITIVAAGYLGPRPWRPMPVVMIPAKLAPKPRPVPADSEARSSAAVICGRRATASWGPSGTGADATRRL